MNPAVMLCAKGARGDVHAFTTNGGFLAAATQGRTRGLKLTFTAALRDDALARKRQATADSKKLSKTRERGSVGPSSETVRLRCL